MLDAPTFDCALCNLYPAGEDAACKFHSDPEHGSHWHLSTAVVSCGEPRRFAFRRIGAEDDEREQQQEDGAPVHALSRVQASSQTIDP